MNPTLLLAIATLALVVGPLIDRLSRRVPVLPALIDGATVGGIVVVSFFHLMPEAGVHLGWWALVWFGIGLFLPVIAERLIAQGSDSLRVPIGMLVVLLLLTHELIESAALASVANEERVGIATLLVVVGHRMPLGLLLWGHTKRRFGSWWSVVALALVASLTWFGPVLVPVEPGLFTAVLSALLAGGLLHLVLQHAPASEHSHENERVRHLASAIGMVIAVAFFVPYLVSGTGSHAHEHASGAEHLPERLRELVLETAPTLLVGVIGASLIEAFLPVRLASVLARGARWRQALAGVAIGTPMPVCSCGILPIYRSLIGRGIGATAGLALLIAAPEIGVDSFLLSFQMLGPATTIARVVCAGVLALVVAWVVGRLADRHTTRCELQPEHEAQPRSVAAALQRGLLETWAHLAPWILFGLLITALVEPWISTEWARATPSWVQVLALTLAGLPTYVCATAATPFAALLLAKGFTPGAVIAFLLTGPATNLTTFGALRRLHSRGVALAFVATALVVTWVLGLAVDALLPPQSAAHSALEPHEHGTLAQTCAVVLAALTLWVLVRVGPRSFVAQLWSSDHSHDHDHEHSDHDAHEHGSAHA